MEEIIILLQLIYALLQNFALQSFLTPFQVIQTRGASRSKLTQGAAPKRNGASLARLHKRKSCWHVIAIPQAGIAAPTLTVMQGFAPKKKCSVHNLPRSLYSVCFHSTQSQSQCESNQAVKAGS